MKKSVGIIGCGWLGKALATQLDKQNYNVKVTVRSDVKQQQLIREGFDSNVFDSTLLESTDLNGDINEQLVFQQHTLVIAIPPGFKQGRTDYAKQVKKLVKLAQQGQVKAIILLSSTGVYQGLTGVVNEHTLVNKKQDKPLLLAEAEDAVLQGDIPGYVLRLAGLIGDDRNPGKFLAGKKGLSGGNEPVNLVHQVDAVGVLMAIIARQPTPSVYLAVSQTHTTKQVYYCNAAASLNLPKPEFLLNDNVDNRIVDDQHTRRALDYSYQYDDLSACLP